MAVIDSGLGGIAVVRALRKRAPTLPLLYVADTAGFPYGNRTGEALFARSRAVVESLRQMHGITHAVLACNTLSTLCLASLRAAFPDVTFVGTVPAIKVAAEQSRTRRFTLLATPNTAHSKYSQELINKFAADCVVDSYGAPNLARMAEATLLGQSMPEERWREELAPCFHDDEKGKTDAIILGCTHYPLVFEQLAKSAPWPVGWVDSSPAIAKHALSQYAGPMEGESTAFVTAEKDVVRYQKIFAREGLPQTAWLNAGDGPPAATPG